jgi:hypothetical protein
VEWALGPREAKGVAREAGAAVSVIIYGDLWQASETQGTLLAEEFASEQDTFDSALSSTTASTAVSRAHSTTWFVSKAESAWVSLIAGAQDSGCCRGTSGHTEACTVHRAFRQIGGEGCQVGMKEALPGSLKTPDPP